MRIAIRAGELRECVKVYSRIETENELGETDYVYTYFKTVHAKVTPISGRSASFPGDVQRAEVTHRVVIRDSAIPNLSIDQYFICRGQRLDVQYWYPIYSQRGWTEIFCSMVIEDGT